MKVVVCGPPHSGKSVFIGGLCENLPRDQRYLFRACPDGEFTLMYQGNGAEQYRRKGKFTQEMVDWYCQSLKSCKFAPIVLVDVGGIPSQENRRILIEGGVSHALILAGDLGKVAEWQQFLDSCGAEVVAVIHSDYDGKSDDIVSDPMVVHHLERGDESVSARPAILAVAEKILKLSSLSSKETSMSDNSLQFAPLTVSAIASAIGKVEAEKTLPNGRVVKGIDWAGEDLPKIADLLHNLSAFMPECVDIDGAGPAWLMSAIAHECHPRAVRLNSPDGYVGVGCQKPSGSGEGLAFTMKAGPGGWTVVEYALDPSRPMSPSELDGIAPPMVGLSDRVILSGRGPNWLMASLAMSYHGRCQACATFQPGVGSTVCWTHTAKVALGTLIPGNV